jgi:hypothetical protein
MQEQTTQYDPDDPATWHLKPKPQLPGPIELARRLDEAMFEGDPRDLEEDRSVPLRQWHLQGIADEYGVTAGAIDALAKRGDAMLARGVEPVEVPTDSEAAAIVAADAPGVEWIVPGRLARRFVIACSGDTGSAKTLYRTAEMIAALHGEPFLGRDPVRVDRWMALDGENDRGVLREQWQALGFRPEDVARVHFTGRERLGALREDPEAWKEYVREVAREFRPDVIDVDTLVRATPVAVMDNDAVVDLFASVLVPLAIELNACLRFWHHESQEGAERRSGSRKSAMMGARQWIDQADGLVTFANTAPLRRTAAADGGADTRSGFQYRIEKLRGHEEANEPRPFTVVGHRTAAGVLDRLAVVADDPDEFDKAKIVAAAPGSTGALAKAAGINRTGDRFRRLLSEAEAEGRLVQRGGEWTRP